MQLSAKLLGREYGLTAEEMNRVLVKQGFLQGTPGDYSLTPKAFPYAEVKDFHRGTGGYACYNRYWITRTFDDSIKDVLDISDDLISEVRKELSADRAARCKALVEERAQANADFLAKQAAENAAQEAAQEAAERAILEKEKLIEKWKTGGKIGLRVGGTLILGYIIYKSAAKVKTWWN